MRVLRPRGGKRLSGPSVVVCRRWLCRPRCVWELDPAPSPPGRRSCGDRRRAGVGARRWDGPARVSGDVGGGSGRCLLPLPEVWPSFARGPRRWAPLTSLAGKPVPARPPCRLADAARVLGASRRLPPPAAGVRSPFVLPPTPLARSRPRPAPGCLPDTPPGGFRGSRRFPPSRLAAAGAEVARRDPVNPAHEFLSARVRRRGSPRACAAGRPGVSPRECAVRPVSRRGRLWTCVSRRGIRWAAAFPDSAPAFFRSFRVRVPGRGAACGRWSVGGRGRSRRPDGRPLFPHAGELSPSLRHPVPRARGDAEVVRRGVCVV